MNRTISFKATFAVASVAALAAFSPVVAEDEAADSKTAENAAASTEKFFAPMMRCTRAEGTVQVQKPRTAVWVSAVPGRYYPLGSVVRTSSGVGPVAAEFAFGEKSAVLVTNVAEFATREVDFGDQERTVVVKAGQVNVSLPRSLGEGLFKVVLPAFVCENLAGESRFDYGAVADGDEAVVRCVTGTMTLKGEHYEIPRMGAANQIRIRTTGSSLFTSIRGESGDCKVKLDMGMVPEKNFETGETKDVPRQLDFALSPQCSIKIFRAKSAIGGRKSVSVMTFGPSGEMKNRFAFSEGRASVNSGELVISTKAADDSAAAKKSEEDDAETVEAKPAAKKGDASEESDEKKDE